jgi:hypothetical protein
VAEYLREPLITVSLTPGPLPLTLTRIAQSDGALAAFRSINAFEWVTVALLECRKWALSRRHGGVNEEAEIV